MATKKVPIKEKKSHSENYTDHIHSCCDTSAPRDTGFFGRALFIVGILIALNMTGHFSNVSIWIQILIGIGFIFMRF